MKRQLAPSPFASPVLKHPCTTRHDTEDTDPAPPPPPSTEAHSTSSPPPSPHHTLHSPSSLTETSDDEVAEPLSVADLYTVTSDLTGVTSTACTCYLNALCLEDSEAGDTLGVGPDGRMPHPLHSTATHLGLTHLSNWQQTPVRVPLPDSHIRNQQHENQTCERSQTQTPGIGTNHFPGIDSGVGVSTELSSEQVTENTGSKNTLSCLDHTPSSQTTPTSASSANPAKVGVSLTPGKKAPAILHSLLPFRLKRDLHAYHMGALPTVPLCATPTSQTTPTQPQQAAPTSGSNSLPRHSVCPANTGVTGITRSSRSLHNTPRR